MPSSEKNIMIIAGEISGDAIGADLLNELKIFDPELKFCGIGGDGMKAAGMEVNFHISDMAFLGFTEVVKHLPFIRKVQRKLLTIIRERNISTAVLIDYPGFNLNFARKIKALGVKVVYYVSPQIWAWGAGRIKKIRKYVNKMVVLFSFEEKFYKDAKINVEFAGHPILDRIKSYRFSSKEELYSRFSLVPEKGILLLMPGSRTHEIEKLFPEMTRAAECIASEFNMQVVAACAPNINKEELIKSSSTELKVVSGFTYDLMKYSSAGIIKSGTSTLEAALFELPMIIVYRTSLLTYLIGRRLIKLKNIGMPNIIAGVNFLPELLQEKAAALNIYQEMKGMLSDANRLRVIKERLKDVRRSLGESGGSKRAAGIIYNELQKS